MGGIKASHFLLFSMITLLYLNDGEGVPYITTCPVELLQKERRGYKSNCGATWYSVETLKGIENKSWHSVTKIFADNIDFDSIPAPVGHEIIELKFKPLEYNIITDD